MARRRKSSFRIPGVSFSMKRALGVTSAKRRIARATGIPMTKSGRQRKAGRMLTGGCLLLVLLVSMSLLLLIAIMLL